MAVLFLLFLEQVLACRPLPRKQGLEFGGLPLDCRLVETPDQIKDRLAAAFPGGRVALIANGAPGGTPSLLLDHEHAVEIARFLRQDPLLRLDYLSNVTGVDWLDATTEETSKTRQTIEGIERDIVDTKETKVPGYLEAIYHLYSMELKHGPVVLRLRTRNRTDEVRVPSLTPVWRGAEFQEREIFDLYGIIFDGHPDLRRLLMWEEFKDHPMRKDYVEPDDYEYEPTPHDEVLERAKQRMASEPRR